MKTLSQARLMVTFARIVEAGSISAAAAQCGIDKASVSRQLGELEDLLGVRLLNRSTRHLSLTDVGRVVFDRATRVLFEVENARSEAESFRSSPSGVLSVSASVAFGRTQIVPHLQAFLTKHPDIDVDLCLLDRQVDLVDEGFDVLLRLCDQPPEQVVAHRLATISYAVVAAPEWLAGVEPITHPQQLAQHNCLFYGVRQRATTWKFRLGREYVSVGVRNRTSINSSEALRHLAVSGMGVALLPSFAVADEIAKGRLKVLLPQYEAVGYLGTSLYALHLPGRFVAPKVRAFVQFLKDEWISSRNWDAWREAADAEAELDDATSART